MPAGPVTQHRWFGLHVVLLSLPWLLLSLAHFVLMVSMAAFEHELALHRLQRGFAAWYTAMLVAGAALARLVWDWMIRGRPLRGGSRMLWAVLLVSLLAKATSWWDMLHVGTALHSHRDVWHLLGGLPLAGCVAHLAVLRWWDGRAAPAMGA